MNIEENQQDKFLPLRRHKHRKRKSGYVQGKHVLEVDPKSPLEVVGVSTKRLGESLESNVQKRTKRKLKKRKKVMNSRECSEVQTNASYPRELGNVDRLSCNWRQLFQTLGSGDSAGSETATKNKKTVSPKSTSSVRYPVKSDNKNSLNNIWFDGVDKELLDPVDRVGQFNTSRKENGLVRAGSFTGLTKALSMDCEMVGIGESGQDSLLARVSIVNLMGNCIYDKYVKTTEPIKDYRTAVSGIRPSDLEKGECFATVQKDVSEMLNKRILVGHAVHNDLKVLFLSHPRRKIRDTAVYKPFRHIAGGNTPSLKMLAQKVLGVKVQDGEHNSIQDAQAAMRLYTMHKKEWEQSLKNKSLKRKNKLGTSRISSSPTSGTAKKLTSSPSARILAKLKI